MKKDFSVFTTGAVSYPILEIIWRGYTHYSMAIAGGLCLLLINKFCCERYSSKAMYVRCAIGSTIITCVELATGVVFNIVLGIKVWDYSNLPLNIYGQVCLPFSVAWFFLCIPAMYICKKVCEYANSQTQNNEQKKDHPIG